jgi:septal ring factor EnvC (AmiA/AmiB activator)
VTQGTPIPIPESGSSILSPQEIDQKIDLMVQRYKKTMKRFGIAAIVIVAVFLLFAIRVWVRPTPVPAKVERLEKKIQEAEQTIKTAQLQRDSVIRLMKEQEAEMEILKQMDIDLVESYNQTQDQLYELQKQKNKNDQRIDRFSSTDIKEYFAREFGSN